MRSFNLKMKFFTAAVIAFFVLALLDFLLYPCTFVRNDLHRVTGQSFDTIYLGTSHGKSDIDPGVIEDETGDRGHNLCNGGEYSIDAYYLLRLIIEKGNVPKRVVYEISPAYFAMEKEEGNNFLLFYHEFPLSVSRAAYFADAISGKNLRTVFFPWYEYELSYELSHIADTAEKKLCGDFSPESFTSDSQRYYENGFLERFEKASIGMNTDGITQTLPEQILPGAMEYLGKIIKLCDDNGIEFAAIITPLPAVTLKRYGESIEATGEFFAEYFESSGVRFIDFNDAKYSVLADHGASAYNDADGHMNGTAAENFSRLLAKLLVSEKDVFDNYYDELGDAVG